MDSWWYDSLYYRGTKENQAMAQEPLQRLVKTEQELLDKELLATALEGLVLIDPGTRRVILTRDARRRRARELIVVYLLGRKALAVLTDGEFMEAATPKEIETATGLPGGTVRPNLRRLYDEEIVETGDNGYTVASYMLAEAANEITHE
jgi:hypothetical protein